VSMLHTAGGLPALAALLPKLPLPKHGATSLHAFQKRVAALQALDALAVHSLALRCVFHAHSLRAGCAAHALCTVRCGVNWMLS
jgi:hypothetical protein